MRYSKEKLETTKDNPLDIALMKYSKLLKFLSIYPSTMHLYFKNTCKTCKNIFIKGSQIRKLLNNSKEYFCYCTNCLKEKTFLENYGVKNPKQSEQVQQKIEKTNIKRYGTKHYINSEDKEKRKCTMLDKYNTEHALQNEECYNKLISTMNERYGVDNAFQIPEIKEKHLEKYYENIDKIQEKAKNTKILRYGDKNYNNPENVKKQ